MTYADFRTRVAKLSYLLIHEIGYNARVGFICRNSPGVAAAFFALTNACATVIPIDPDKSPAEISEWIRTTKCTHIFVTNDLTNHVRELLNTERIYLPIVEIEKKQGGEYDPTFTPAPEHQPKDTNTVVIFRSQGITGKPKYIQYNHKNLAAAITPLKQAYKLGANDKVMSIGNWAHPFQFIHGMLFPIMTGASIVVDHGMDNKEFLQYIQDSKVTRLIGSPPQFLKLLLACRAEHKGIPTVRSVVVGLGDLQPEVQRAFETLKVSVAHVFGQAEAGWTLAMEDHTEHVENRIRGCMGKPMQGMKYKIMDENFDEIEGSERVGYLAVSTPAAMTGYLDREKETKNVLRGSWVYTGDYVKVEGEDENMRLYFLGRRDELIIEQGVITGVGEIDWALKGQMGVEDAAGFVLKDARDRPVVAAAVVKVEKSPLNEKAVIDMCASRLSGDLVPKVVVFTDQIPRDAGGNINRIKLRAQFLGVVV